MVYRKTSLIILFILLLVFVSCTPKQITLKTKMTVAVWDLDDVGPSEGMIRPSLGEPFAAQIMKTLKKRNDFFPVEREHLLLALEEQRMSMSLLVDESARLNLGRLIGAQYMVFGGYQIIGDMMRVDLRLVDVECGKVVKAVKETAPVTDLSGWFDAVRAAAEHL